MIRDPETHRLLLDTISRFVRERLIPAEHEVVETDAIPEAIVAAMREIGLFGLTVPEDFGGFGLTMEEEVDVTFELTRASPAFRSIIGTNNGIGSQGIVIDGTPEQKAKWLPRLASGELIGSFALTEPGLGLGCGVADHVGAARWGCLHRQRDEALHHECSRGRRLHAHGPDRPGAKRRRRRFRVHRRIELAPD